MRPTRSMYVANLNSFSLCFLFLSLSLLRGLSSYVMCG